MPHEGVFRSCQGTLPSHHGKDTAIENAKFHSMYLSRFRVCKRVAIDRIEKMKLGKYSFSKLCARVSLGCTSEKSTAP